VSIYRLSNGKHSALLPGFMSVVHMSTTTPTCKTDAGAGQ